MERDAFKTEYLLRLGVMQKTVYKITFFVKKPTVAVQRKVDRYRA
jgi:hypothetical protein